MEGTQPSAQFPRCQNSDGGHVPGVGTQARVSGPNTHTKSRGNTRHLVSKWSLDLDGPTDLASLLTYHVALGKSPPLL